MQLRSLTVAVVDRLLTRAVLFHIGDQQPDELARFYRPELDALRFFAFFTVFNFHVNLSGPAFHFFGREVLGSMGAYGMPMFFFLSSYLITELLLREQLATGSVHIPAFFLRRILRIWPLYFGFIGFALILAHFYRNYSLEPGRVLAMLFLAGNWYMAKHGVTPSPSGPLWSISLEEQFYLVWPFLARFGSKILGAVCAALIAMAYIALAVRQPALHETDESIWCNSLIQFQFFAVGGLVALALHHGWPRWTGTARALILSAGVASWIGASCLFHVLYPEQVPGPVLLAGYILIGLGCVLLFMGVLGLPSHFVPRWLVYLGRISYGLYVFHVFGIDVAAFILKRLGREVLVLQTPSILFMAEYVLSLSVTLLLAALSYRYFESPFLNLKKRFTFVPSRGECLPRGKAHVGVGLNGCA